MSKDYSFKALMAEGLKINKSLISSSKKAAGAILDNKKITSNPDSAEKRLSICNKCPKLCKQSGRCELCGCFVTIKVKLDFESCPAGKW
jgi:hypothetical protein